MSAGNTLHLRCGFFNVFKNSSTFASVFNHSALFLPNVRFCKSEAADYNTRKPVQSLSSRGLVLTLIDMQDNEIDMDALRIMGAPDFEEINIPMGPAVKVRVCHNAL